MRAGTFRSRCAANTNCPRRLALRCREAWCSRPSGRRGRCSICHDDRTWPTSAHVWPAWSRDHEGDRGALRVARHVGGGRGFARGALRRAREHALDRILDGAPQWRRFTPGRIEIFGKHTDYAGGHSLLAAVPRGITLAARQRADGIVRVGDIFDGQVIEVDPSQRGAAALSRAAALRARRRASIFPQLPRLRARHEHRDRQRSAARLRIEQLERAGGRVWRWRSSSARGCASAPNGSGTRRVHDLAWYLGCVENGLNFPGLPGSAGVGTHGGSEDHTAILTVPDRSRQPVSFRPGAAARRDAHAGRLDVRDRVERRAGRQGRLGQGSLQPRCGWRPRAACDLEQRTRRRRRARLPTR